VPNPATLPRVERPATPGAIPRTDGRGEGLPTYKTGNPAGAGLRLPHQVERNFDRLLVDEDARGGLELVEVVAQGEAHLLDVPVVGLVPLLTAEWIVAEVGETDRPG
jgi:hypothetical protein